MAQRPEQDRPTVLFVHGAWHTPALYQPTIENLLARDYPVQAPLLPTCDQEALLKDPSIDMQADAQL